MAIDISRQLTKADRKELAREQELMKLYEMRTCIERKWTLEDQAQELGVSIATVKRWAASEEFKRLAAQVRPATSIMLSAAKDFVAEELLPLDPGRRHPGNLAADVRKQRSCQRARCARRYGVLKGPRSQHRDDERRRQQRGP
jgi:hypothetical protein